MQSNRHPLTQNVLVKMTPELRNRAEEAARRVGLPLATFVRSTLLRALDEAGSDVSRAA